MIMGLYPDKRDQRGWLLKKMIILDLGQRQLWAKDLSFESKSAERMKKMGQFLRAFGGKP
jgi:hypothetical protein